MAKRLETSGILATQDRFGNVIKVELRPQKYENLKKPEPFEGSAALIFLFGLFVVLVASSISSKVGWITLGISFLAYLAIVPIMRKVHNKRLQRYESLVQEKANHAAEVLETANKVEQQCAEEICRALKQDADEAERTARADHSLKLVAWTSQLTKFEEKTGKEYIVPKISKTLKSLGIDESCIPACQYHPNERLIAMDTSLFSLDDFKVNHSSAALRLSTRKISNKQWNEEYDAYIYQFCLLAIWVGCKCDTKNLADTFVFNGWVTYIDPTTGNQKTACLISIQVTKQEFATLNLERVDAKACFRSLKGISGARLLSERVPVKPVLQINKNDSRFVNSYDVADGLDESVNIATMDWLDFENLTRELFAKHFGTGCEVKLTQSSRDGGVDAVIFDLDPIKGGKIVIQAKRYTNVVGVSAVRDLYGTVMNEGAMKGILVTTAYYGMDAYEFCKDKPLTLINGDQLLYLLEQYGYKAKIDLKAARDTFAENA